MNQLGFFDDVFDEDNRLKRLRKIGESLEKAGPKETGMEWLKFYRQREQVLFLKKAKCCAQIIEPAPGRLRLFISKEAIYEKTKKYFLAGGSKE